VRCAVVEFNHYHDEVLPTFVWLLNRLGITPDVYLVERAARRGAFAGSEELRWRPRRVEGMDRLQGIPFRLQRYELVIVSSMEPDSLLDRIERIDAPILGVVHNTELLVEDARYREFFAAPEHRPLVLGAHIAGHFAEALGWLPWILHVVLAGGSPSVATTDATTGDRVTFAVSGNVEFHRRNYASLLEATSALASEGVPFVVRIVGRSTRPDGKALRAEVKDRGLGHVFEFSPGEIDHPTFFGLVRGSDFSLPLIDTTRDAFRPYLETKLASSVPFAIGLGVPLVAHEALVAAYGLEGTGPDYADGGLEGAMRRAMSSTTEARAQWRAAVDRKRAAILDASLANLRDAISAVTAPVDSARPGQAARSA
jgi:hypothetical protein